MPIQNFISLVNGKYDSIFGTQVSLGATSEGKLVALNSLGQIDSTMIPSSGGGTVTSITVTTPTGLQVSGSGTQTITTNGTFALTLQSGYIIPTTTFLNGLVPYTGAASNVNLGAYNITSSAFVTSGGLPSQYVKGDGTLGIYNAGGGGGGASQVFYFNGGVAASVAGYYQMSTTANTGASADFSTSSNGYIASFLTDVGSPNQLNIPAGNWDFQIYMSSSSSGGSPYFYVELYKYNGSTFTLISSGSLNPEYITNGTSVDLYTTNLAVSATTLLASDRLAVRVYVNTSGRTITMHTQDSNLSDVITNFTTGITALNGLTEQLQYFATGISGTDFNISSSVATHTFNLPIASAINTGKLSASDWTIFNNKQDAYTILSTFGALANSAGYLYNNGSGVLSYATPTSGTVTSVTLSTPTGLQVSSGSTQTITTSGTFALTLTSGYTIPTTSQIISTFTTTGNSGASTFTSGTLNIPNYTADGLLPSQTSNSGKYLTTNGTTTSWATISAMTNPMTTQGDTIYGGSSGTPTRLALGTTNYFYQAGATAPQWFNLFGTANTWTEMQTLTKAVSGAPFYGITVQNTTVGTTYNTTGSGINLLHNLVNAKIYATNSTSVGTQDRSLYYESNYAHVWYSGGKNASPTAPINYIWFMEGTQDTFALKKNTGSNPRVLAEIYTGNAGATTTVQLNLTTASGSTQLIGAAGFLGINTTPTSTLHINGSAAFAVANSVSLNTTLTSTNYYQPCTGTCTITLPTAVGITGRVYMVKNNGTGVITIATTSLQTIDGVTTKTLNTQYQYITVISNGANWEVIN